MKFRNKNSRNGIPFKILTGKDIGKIPIPIGRTSNRREFNIRKDLNEIAADIRNWIDWLRIAGHPVRMKH